MQRKMISIGTWAFIRGTRANDPIPLATAVKHLHALKFDGLELAGLAPHMHPRSFPARAQRMELKKLLDDHGLTVSGLAADFTEVPPALVKPTEYIEVVQANLDICHDPHIPHLRVDIVSPRCSFPRGRTSTHASGGSPRPGIGQHASLRGKGCGSSGHVWDCRCEADGASGIAAWRWGAVRSHADREDWARPFQ